jgi:hypothetical protein
MFAVSPQEDRRPLISSIRRMAKKRTNFSDGVKMASHMIQAAEVLTAAQDMTSSKWRQLVEGIIEKFFMGLSIALVCALFWLGDLVLRALKN